MRNTGKKQGTGALAMNERYEGENERLKQRRRNRKRRELRRRRRQRLLIQRTLLAGAIVILAAAGLLFLLNREKQEADQEEKAKAPGPELSLEEGSDSSGSGTIAPAPEPEEPEPEDAEQPEEEGKTPPSFSPAEEILYPGDELASSNAIFVDVKNRVILAGKEEKSRMVPASMTKVLTLLVAAEHVEDLDQRFAVAAEAIDYSFRYDCSCAGFEKEEEVTIRDLMYGTVLPSGAEAAMGLAIYVSGSQEAFVELMNEKLEELGLSDTAHFTNCVGVYDDDHYCTAYDMAVIMQAALDNELCREVLSARTYLTSATEQHPEGLLLSNWFLRRIEDKDTGGKVSAGKTGYVDRSGFCAVSYGTDEKGGEYICVTANASGNWPCINDHTWLYKHFSEETKTEPE